LVIFDEKVQKVLRILLDKNLSDSDLISVIMANDNGRPLDWKCGYNM